MSKTSLIYKLFCLLKLSPPIWSGLLISLVSSYLPCTGTSLQSKNWWANKKINEMSPGNEASMREIPRWSAISMWEGLAYILDTYGTSCEYGNTIKLLACLMTCLRNCIENTASIKRKKWHPRWVSLYFGQFSCPPMPY